MRAGRSPVGRWCLGAVLAGAALAASGATTLYKWVDANGVTHYSDHPEPGAERVRIAAAQTYKSQPASASGAPRADNRPAAPASYTSLQVTNPADGAVLWNVGGRVDVSAALEPELANGHQLWFVLDGKSQPASAAGSATLEVPRGTHTLAATVTDGAGNELISSAPISFVVQQTSAQTPPQGPDLKPKPKPKP